MLRNLASALILTERDAEDDLNPPKIKGRIVTTLHKAKEVRPLVEKCITLGGKALAHADAAEKLGTKAERKSKAWKEWRDRVKHGISPLFFVGQVTTSVLFIAYSAMVGNRIFVVGNVLVLAAALAGGAILAYNRARR